MSDGDFSLRECLHLLLGFSHALVYGGNKLLVEAAVIENKD
jgi:hypothetical protein